MTVISESVPVSVEERRQVALAVAEQCIAVLKEDLGATEAIVFGSLRGDGPWHDQSDLDLAVCGMTSKEIWNAFSRLEKIVPGWLPFDLVAVDRADERVRDRILKTTPMPKNKYLSLKLRLEDEIAAIDKLISQLVELLAQTDRVPKAFVTPTLASYSENFYSGCEKIAERVAVALDGGLPTGSNWHEQLLLQISEPGGQARPRLWDKEVLRSLDEYRRFRHRVRHLYNFDLDDDTVLAMAQQVPAVFESVKLSVEQFGEWLVQRSEA